MRRSIGLVCLALALVAAAGLYSSHAQEAAADSGAPGIPNWAGGNPLKIALLKWYQANVVTSFPTPPDPMGVVFDGENMWVCTGATGNDKVVKLRASDGANLGVFDVGYGAMGMAFDGANVWIANSLDNYVSKLRASDGKLLGTFKTGGPSPFYLAFDGQHIWVTNQGNNSLAELNASDGSIVGVYQQSHGVWGIAFDGTHIWVSDFYSAVYQYTLDGKEVRTIRLAAYKPSLMAFDGANMWVLISGNGTVSKIQASSGRVLETFGTGNATIPYGIAYDGQYIWISGGGYIVQMRPGDGKWLLQQLLGCCVGQVGFDGANTWVAGGSGKNVAYKM
jgi:DNA-binding beta-propeller fold protein YncE